MPSPADVDAILADLNPEQRRAAEAVRGPVCILAGAGSGKTTTVTRRLALQVASGTFRPGQLLAVTFTDKAAGEMRDRLAALGVSGVRARTFHATALAQLHHFAPETGAILPSKAVLLAPIVRSLHQAYRFRPLAEFANEIEWAKNRRLPPERYLEGLDGHQPPVPPDVMLRVYRGYEERKRRGDRIDFEDVLELLVRVYESSPEAIRQFRQACSAITVDEYQDVNLLQQTLLDLWLGERDDLCVVGDDYQAIYSFTGATPRYLLTMPSRYPGSVVVRLEENYRSTPEILGVANGLVPRLGGAEKTLRAVRPPGSSPSTDPYASIGEEVDELVRRIRQLREDGVREDEIAVLYRVNARSDDLEGQLASAGIPYQVRGGAFLQRPAARALLRLLRRAVAGPAAENVHEAAVSAGLTEPIPDGLGDEGVTFQEDLRRLVALAAALPEEATVTDFLADLEARFGSEGKGRGVQLLTYHRAKGLEFEAVFLPFLTEGELPFKQARTDEAIAEERRLLYVGLTRAKRTLFLSWSGKKPSRFLAELGVHRRPPARTAPDPGIQDGPVFVALRAWRLERARADAVPAYVVFDNKTLSAIAEAMPATPGELASIHGVGPAKLERYGDEVLGVLRGLPVSNRS